MNCSNASKIMLFILLFRCSNGDGHSNWAVPVFVCQIANDTAGEVDLRPFTKKARIVSPTLVLWVALAFGMTVAEAACPVRVFAIRGVGGVLFSRGMNVLCDELAELVSVTCTVEDFTEVANLESQAQAADAAGAQVVLVGHSMGRRCCY
jgi:hypothetical protein